MILAFERLFNCKTADMRTFHAYYMAHPTHGQPMRPERAAAFLPEGATLEQVLRLSRIEFFVELKEMFAAEIEAEAARASPGARPSQK